MNYVIIGNSAAAVGCIEGIRSVTSEGKITVLSKEHHHTYSRPLISYYLYGKTDLQRMKYRPDSFYADNGCELVYGEVTGIDEKAVTLSDGKKIPYDKLLVATGSRAFVPPFTGLDTVPEKYTFMSLDDALELEKVLDKDKTVLIVGGGLIGLKCAEGIYGRVKKITIADMAPRVLSSILDDDSAAPVQEMLTEKGIALRLGCSIKGFEGKVAKTDGDDISFDILVLAVGVRPNTEPVKDAGGKVGRGILTDHKQRTSLENVWAAGDCTESDDITCNQSRILALLPNAYRQGETAGIDMAGGDISFDCAMPMNAMGLLGMHIMTAGSTTGDCFIDRSNGLKKLWYGDDRLNGFILIDDVEKAGIYTALIRERKPLSSIDFDLICKQPSLLCFSKKYRDEKLAGKAR
ncbi:MAG TPA: FAD-dependent oxidoreductase [Oscillospiraceae bacterium]|nr:FAD-dependent oxidoreductase [Oscillospiraceae bacterium]HPS35292.1 FAD-dependent oxidoreductase [Oscillospiraceae bacterium]